MTNKEKYVDRILNIACHGNVFGVEKNTGAVRACSTILCSECTFFNGKVGNHIEECIEKRKKWCDSEYIERPKISKKDRGFLECIRDEFEYIARDRSGKLFVYASEPSKTKYNVWDGWDEQSPIDDWLDVGFPMVKWSDEEPWNIEDLKKLEVVEDYENN